MKNTNIPQQIEFLRLNYNWKSVSACYNRSDALSHADLRVVSSAQLVILHRKLSGRKLMYKKKRYGPR